MNDLTCMHLAFSFTFCCHALPCTQLKISPADVPIVEVHTASALKGIGAVCRRLIDMMLQPRGVLAASSSSSQAPAAAPFMLIARSRVVDPVGEEEVAAVADAATAGDAITFATIIGRVVQVRTLCYVRVQASVLRLVSQ